MKVLLLVALLPLTLAEEGFICGGWEKRIAAAPGTGDDKYWECGAKGTAAVLQTCPEGKIYKASTGRCRKAKTQRLVKRADGAVPKDLELLEMEALSPHGLGKIYDARKDQFKSGEVLWSQNKMDEVVVTQDQVYSHLDVYQENDVSDKAFNLGVSASLTLGFLSGMIEVSGAAEYLRDEKISSNIARIVMSYKSTTKSKTIPLNTPISYAQICEAAKTEEGGTHVVTSVLYGLRSFMMFDQEAYSNESVEKIKGELSVKINSIPGFKFEGSAWIDIYGEEAKTYDRMRVKSRSDALTTSPTSYVAAIESINKIQEQAPTGNTPIRYQLTPLSYLCDDSTALLKEIGDNLVNQAIKALVDISKTKQETEALLATNVATKIGPISDVLNTFKSALTRFETNFKTDIQKQLKDLKAGKGNEKDFKDLIQKYMDSAYYYDKANLFLEQRKRAINTISLIMDETVKNKAPGDRVIFTVADAKSANDNGCLIDSEYSYIFKLNVLPNDDAAEKYIDSKGDVQDESHQWYNNIDTVGEVGGMLKSYIKFGLASWPEVVAQPPKHCFLVALENIVDKSDKFLNIQYDYAHRGRDRVEGDNFIPPNKPPTPECYPLYDGFKIGTESADNSFVKKHWVEATIYGKDDIKTSKNNPGDSDTVFIHELTANTAYNITTKYKVLDGEKAVFEDLGFSPKSDEVECVTAPTSPVRNLEVTAATSDSLTINWAQPQDFVRDVEIKYVLTVRKDGASDSESIITEKAFSATEQVIQDLDPATLYEILIHTKTNLAVSGQVKILHSTAPKSIPFPEVSSVSETSVQLIEKLSLVELPTGLITSKLVVLYNKVNEADGSTDGEQKTLNVQLSGSRADKTFSIGGLTGGESYGIIVTLESTYGGMTLTSEATEQLIITTPFGGTEVEKVQDQFDKIKETTDSRISAIDSAVNAQETKVNNLNGQLNAYYNEAMTNINSVSAITVANFTTQENILTGTVKKSCIETGIKYYDDRSDIITSRSGIKSIYQCLDKCREQSGCNGVIWNKKAFTCKLSKKRRGSPTTTDKDSISANRVCYDTMTGSSAKWATCIEKDFDYGGADISGKQSYGFETEWDCMGWCINTAGCVSVTFQPSTKKCWLKHKPKGDTRKKYTGLISISLPCMQS